MLETLRVNTLMGRSMVIVLDKILYLEEAPDGQSTFIFLSEGHRIQCTEDICQLQEMIKRIAHRQV